MDETKFSISNRRLRMLVFFNMKATTIVCFISEILIFFLYRKTNEFVRGEIDYLLWKICIPTTVNLFLLLIGFLIGRKGKFSDNTKNFIISFCFALMTSQISIVHSYYMVLWISPVLSVFASVMFNKKGIMIMSLIVSIFTVIVAAKHQYDESMNALNVILENAFIALIVEIILYAVIKGFKAYSKSLLERANHFYTYQLEYANKLHFDFLTGVYSREYIFRQSQEFLSSCKTSNPVGVAIIDIDNFKKINDTYGHKNGDVVLSALGNVLKSISTKDILTGRFGGEEFIITFRGIEFEKSKALLEQVRIEIENLKFDFVDKPVTISGGFSMTEKYIPFEDILSIADKKLYEAKNNGKNKIIF